MPGDHGPRRAGPARVDRGPAAALLALGLLTGAAGTALVLDPEPADEPVAEVQEAPATIVRVGPVDVSCVRSSELAEEVLDLAREATGAMAELDARRLQQIVDQMQQRDEELRELADRCQAAGAAGGAQQP